MHSVCHSVLYRLEEFVEQWIPCFHHVGLELRLRSSLLAKLSLTLYSAFLPDADCQ